MVGVYMLLMEGGSVAGWMMEVPAWVMNSQCCQWKYGWLPKSIMKMMMDESTD